MLSNNIFCSYEPSSRVMVNNLCQYFGEKSLTTARTPFETLENSFALIDNSQVFMCFLTNEYCFRTECAKEFEYAKQNAKKILVIRLENTDNIVHAKIDLKALLQNVCILNAHDAHESVTNRYSKLFHEMNVQLDVMLDRWYDVFLAFDTDSRQLAHWLYVRFGIENIDAWYDRHHIYLSDSSNEIPKKVLTNSAIVVFLVTKGFLRNCEFFAKLANDLNKKCVFVLLEDIQADFLPNEKNRMAKNNQAVISCALEKNCLQYLNETSFLKLCETTRNYCYSSYAKQEVSAEFSQISDKVNELTSKFRAIREKSNLQNGSNGPNSFETEKSNYQQIINEINNETSKIERNTQEIDVKETALLESSNSIIDAFKKSSVLGNKSFKTNLDVYKHYKNFLVEKISINQRQIVLGQHEMNLLDELSYGIEDELKMIRRYFPYLDNHLDEKKSLANEWRKIEAQKTKLFSKFKSQLNSERQANSQLNLIDKLIN